MTSRLMLPGSDLRGNALPVLFSDLLDGPQRRDGSVQALADTAGHDDIAQLAVGVVISFTGLVLLLRRSDDFLNSVWQLPAGTVEPGETLVEAVTRIVGADTGLAIIRVRSYLGSFDYQVASGQWSRQYNFVAEVVPTDEITLTRHQEYAWARPDRTQPVSSADQMILAAFVAGLTR